jgi:hypothetical protein
MGYNAKKCREWRNGFINKKEMDPKMASREHNDEKNLQVPQKTYG